MKLNHLNLCTSDVAGLSEVFARHFGFDVSQSGADHALLRGDDGFFLVLMAIDPTSPRTYPKNFHIGFMVASSDEVRAKHRELCERGRQPAPIKIYEALGAHWTSFMLPMGDGIAIEVNAHD